MIDHEVLANLFACFDVVPQKFHYSIMNIISNILLDNSIDVIESQIADDDLHFTLIDFLNKKQDFQFQKIILRTLYSIFNKLKNAHVGLSSIERFIPSTLNAFLPISYAGCPITEICGRMLEER